MIGLVYKCKDKKQIKNILIELATQTEADDMAVIGEYVYKGPGEITYGISENLFPSDSEEFARSLRDAIKAVGTTECDCTKIVFIISDEFDETFESQFKKLMNISKNKYYETGYYVFNLGEPIDSYTYKNVETYNCKDTSELRNNILTVFNELDDFCEVGIDDEDDIL